MLTRMALPILAALALCSGATAQSPTKIFRIGLVHVGAPTSCIMAPGFNEAFARRAFTDERDSAGIVNHRQRVRHTDD